MERSNAGMVRDFQKMGCVGRVPATDNKNEVQSVVLRDVNEFDNGILAFLYVFEHMQQY